MLSQKSSKKAPKLPASILDIEIGHFQSKDKQKEKKNIRSQFSNFVTWSADESEVVENYRFLENSSINFNENQARISENKKIDF